MRRLLLLAPVLLALAYCGVFQSSEDEATDAAREVATKAGERLASQLPRTADEVGYSASHLDGVEVLRVTGDSTHDGDGVELIVRTSGMAYNGWFDVSEVMVQRCFTVRVSPSLWRGEEARDVDCPDGPPLRFPRLRSRPRCRTRRSRRSSRASRRAAAWTRPRCGGCWTGWTWIRRSPRR